MTAGFKAAGMEERGALMPNLDTLPKYLLRNVRQWGDRENAIRKKKYGIWNEYTWKEHYQNIKHFC